MKVVILSAALGLLSPTPVADVVPTWNVQASCNSAVSADRASNATDVQSIDACVNDESQARDELTKGWTTYPGALRTRCESEAGGSGSGVASYVDLLVCLQTFTDPGNKPAMTVSMDTLKGSGKHRHKTVRKSP